ncbi:6-phosphogluconolactonase [Candidatus Vecturithrix granuli]|uniref:6-phosphogluconolactonase n=1 Tax=Vecturithrix granuli TaxID=1499967 RepID=A0A081C1B0_VECG1|nr:6-phosphogluconolactonase [Candidatus Vecturithrix granuli]
MTTNAQQFQTLQALSTAAAELFCRVAQQSLKEHAHFTVALSGGSTPRLLYEYLCQEPYLSRIPWSKTHIFWGDERYVPSDHPDSNFAMASQALIQHVPLPVEHIHRIPTELASPEQTAEVYETTLRKCLSVFDHRSQQNNLPVFDLILLGMGPDGHTASLFPESPVLEEHTRWVAATPVPNLNPPVRRITLTYPVLNAGKTVLFLVSGKQKQAIVQQILNHSQEARQQYPAARINPSGNLLWMLV